MLDPNNPYLGVEMAIGNTPLIRLLGIPLFRTAKVYAKLEGMNPGGSSKDRAALSMLEAALASGKLRPGMTVVESSSGNMAISLAQLCVLHQLKLIVVVDAKTPKKSVEILGAYGARVDIVTSADAATGEFLPARLARIRHLLRDEPDCIWLDQYSNQDNARAHMRTMEEICRVLNGGVDYLVVPVSTCGTALGCAMFIAKENLSTKIIAVDAIGSVIFGGPPAKRLLPGHGAAIKPALAKDLKVSFAVQVSDSDCVVGCRSILRYEGLLAGASSGGALVACERVLSQLPGTPTIAIIFPDRGERYMDTVFCDSWVEKQLGPFERKSDSQTWHPNA